MGRLFKVAHEKGTQIHHGFNFAFLLQQLLQFLVVHIFGVVNSEDSFGDEWRRFLGKFQFFGMPFDPVLVKL